MAASTKIVVPASAIYAGTSDTPILSPSGSADPSPAFERLATPETDDVAGFEFDIGPPAEKEGVEVEIPECWGHRGVSAAFILLAG